MERVLGRQREITWKEILALIPDLDSNLHLKPKLRSTPYSLLLARQLVGTCPGGSSWGFMDTCCQREFHGLKQVDRYHNHRLTDLMYLIDARFTRL